MTVEEFLNTGYEFTDAENKALVRSNKFLGRTALKLIKQKYIFIIDLKALISQGDVLEAVILLLGKVKPLTLEELLKAPHTDFVYFSKWLEDELKMLVALEKDLTTEVDEDLNEAGVSDLNIFQEINVIDGLAGGDLLKWAEIEQLEYEKVYTKLLKNKTENNIAEHLRTIRQRKIKK